MATIVIANACNQEGTPGMQVPGKSGVPDSALAGKTMFEASCVRCHGMDASGLSGPSLKKAKIITRNRPWVFYKVVITGISGTGMPGHWDLTDTDCAHLYAYISYLRKQGMETPAGDTAAGRLVTTNLFALVVMSTMVKELVLALSFRTSAPAEALLTYGRHLLTLEQPYPKAPTLLMVMAFRYTCR